MAKFEIPDSIPVAFPLGGPLPRGKAVSSSAVKAGAFCVRLDNPDRNLLQMVANFCDMDRATLARWAMIQVCKSIIREYEKQTGEPFPRG